MKPHHARGLTPPHDDAMERAVLSALLLDPYTLAEVAAIVEAGDFYRERHQLIFQAMQAIAAEGHAIDLRTLQGRLERDGVFEQVGGIAYLACMDEDLPDLSRVAVYAGAVRKLAAARRVITTCDLIVREVAAQRDPAVARDRLAAARDLVDQATVAAAGGAFADRVPVATTRLRAIKAGDRSAGIPTGLPALDAQLVGLARGELVILAGYAKQGKTTLVEQWLWNWVRRGIRCLFISLEMTDDQMADRMIGRVMKRPPSDLRAGRFLVEELDRAEHEIEAAEWPRYLIELYPRSCDVRDVEAEVRAAQRLHGCDVIVVDHLHELTSRRAGGEQRRRQEVTEAAAAMKQLARELDVPVVCPAQLSRSGGRGAAEGRRPGIWDLGESSEIERKADTILLFWAGDADSPQHRTLRIDRARQGEGGFEVDLDFNPHTRSYRELAPAYRHPDAPANGARPDPSIPPWEEP